MALIVSLISKNTSSVGSFSVSAMDPYGLWLLVLVFALTLIADTTLFLFFLLNINSGMEFFNKRPFIGKHVVSKMKGNIVYAISKMA